MCGNILLPNKVYPMQDLAFRFIYVFFTTFESKAQRFTAHLTKSRIGICKNNRSCTLLGDLTHRGEIRRLRLQQKTWARFCYSRAAFSHFFLKK
jgi:hypothetical protein